MNQKDRYYLPENEKEVRTAMLRKRFEQAHPMKNSRSERFSGSPWKTLYFLLAALAIAWVINQLT